MKLTRRETRALLKLGLLKNLSERWARIHGRNPKQLAFANTMTNVIGGLILLTLSLYAMFVLNWSAFSSNTSEIISRDVNGFITGMMDFALLVWLVVKWVCANRFHHDLRQLTKVFRYEGMAVDVFLNIDDMAMGKIAEEITIFWARELQRKEYRLGPNSPEATKTRKRYKQVRAVLRSFDFGDSKDDKYFPVDNSSRSVTCQIGK